MAKAQQQQEFVAGLAGMQEYQDVKEWLQRLNRLEFKYRVTEAGSYGGCTTK